ncbi:hypothetical protein SDC9_159901 [bioreactor metagenome]|uniref:Uncharacterized protein n=1 Tax=bioreactor metagenome TaxID=1076179 RepID=A0A645FK39_9ZZZZ
MLSVIPKNHDTVCISDLLYQHGQLYKINTLSHPFQNSDLFGNHLFQAIVVVRLLCRWFGMPGNEFTFHFFLQVTEA